MKLVRPITILDANLSSSSVLENDYAAWNAGTTYALGDRVIVVAANVHKVYESLQAGNLNNNPQTSPAWWIEVGPTNRWAMFDASPSTQTTRADEIEVVIALTERIDTITLLNISAASARVQVDVAGEGNVYDETIDLVDVTGIDGWWAWFFDPIQRRFDGIFENLPPYAASTVTITLTDTGATVACGVCALGLSKELGETQWSPRVGIRDYSVKKADDFGNYQIVERAFAKRASFTLEVRNDYIDHLAALLASYRATAVVWIGTSLYGSTVIYGFFWDFEIDIKYPTKSICSLSIEGLA